MGEKTGPIVTLFVCMYKAVCAGSGGEDVDDCGRIVKRMAGEEAR